MLMLPLKLTQADFSLNSRGMIHWSMSTDSSQSSKDTVFIAPDGVCKKNPQSCTYAYLHHPDSLTMLTFIILSSTFTSSSGPFTSLEPPRSQWVMGWINNDQSLEQFTTNNRQPTTNNQQPQQQQQQQQQDFKSELLLTGQTEHKWYAVIRNIDVRKAGVKTLPGQTCQYTFTSIWESW